MPAPKKSIARKRHGKLGDAKIINTLAAVYALTMIKGSAADKKRLSKRFEDMQARAFEYWLEFYGHTTKTQQKLLEQAAHDGISEVLKEILKRASFCVGATANTREECTISGGIWIACPPDLNIPLYP